MTKKVFLLILSIISWQTAKAQDSKSQYWTRYFNELSTRLWEVDTELENRRLFFPNKQKQLILRTAILYKFNDKVKAGAGFLYSRTNDEEQNDLAIPELRPFQQLDIKHKAGKLNFDHQLRIEQRFEQESVHQQLINNYDFTLRTRYRIQAGYPFLKKEKEKGHLAVQVSEEVFANIANSKSFFDQNRLYAGLVFQPAKSIALELGYMWMFQKETDKPDENWDILRFTLRHYLDF
ncbi:DUF2490 domain-containing protein [Emticicia sp. C21]|uniref:DUF2490 domain-containing protein n=1 Tax=Emticicia sp. C21 TaxID=2302915 RepID=UPI000E34D4FD|nr:DUF2490 domain-containing protein [Emticicia sp. C21]RFS17747.1 DUF2490 domain-containing protein [Emticicia sp. C21]